MMDDIGRELAAASTQSLLARHLDGDASALEALILRHHSRIERIVRVRLGPSAANQAALPDVLQDVYVRIVERVHRFEHRKESRFIDWVARLAQNVITDGLRRASARKRGGGLADRLRANSAVPAPDELPAVTSAVHSKVARHENAELLDLHLHALSEAHREVIVLRDFAGEDWATIAQVMGRASAAACQELHRRAMTELRRRFQSRT